MELTFNEKKCIESSYLEKCIIEKIVPNVQDLQERFEQFIYEKMQDEIQLTDEEIGYRRGYLHGFVWGQKNPNMNYLEVRAWKNGKDLTCPPGTPMAGTKLEGLTKGNEKDFFITKLKNFKHKRT